MSKQLYINNKRVLIDDDNTYFPFSYKINDLENINIVGVPVSKTIEIPRVGNNDEIFGYIGELTRIAIGGDENLVSVSFNQTKKSYYKLFNDSILVSEGTMSVINVTNESYSIILYDIIIDTLEKINGNTETGDGFLNELDIVLNDYSIFNVPAYSTNVKTLIENNSEIKPCVNIKEYKSTGTNSYIQVNNVYSEHTLPTELTPIQFQTLKPYDFEYSIPVSNVIKSINQKYDLITYDTNLETFFNDVHLNCGSPKNTSTQDNYLINSSGLTGFFGYTSTLGSNYYNSDNLIEPIPAKSKIPFTSDIINKGGDNGNYHLEIPISFSILYKDDNNVIYPTKNLCTVLTTTGPTAWGSYPETSIVYYGGNHPNAAPNGTYVGSLWINLNIASYSGTTKVYSTKPVKTELRLIKGENLIEVLDTNGNIIELKVTPPNVNLTLTFDYYLKTQNVLGLVNYIEFDFDDFGSTGNVLVGTRTMLFANGSGGYLYTQWITPTIQDINVNFKSIDFRCGQSLCGQTLFPKISIKSFIIEMTKYFNLSIKIKNGKLNIQTKKYYVTNDVPMINRINSLNSNNFNFSNLTLKNKITSNKLIETYKTNTQRTYGEKRITTGYNIKITNKDITFGVSSPVLIKDTNSYAYDKFGGYYNGGYSKHLNGVTTGLEETITLGYPNTINNNLYISNDTQFESGLISSTLVPTETKFVLSNTSLVYNSTTNEYTFSNMDNTTTGVRLVTKHLTFSPYKFNGTSIIKSTEINKPLYNFANITDANYSDKSTLYYRFHKNYIIDIYNINTHVLDVNMFINGVIDEYKIYNYNNSQYIISEIPEYDPTTPDLYDIKLLRVNDTNNYISNVFNPQLSIYFKGEWDSYTEYNEGDIVSLTDGLIVNYYESLTSFNIYKLPSRYPGRWILVS